MDFSREFKSKDGKTFVTFKKGYIDEDEVLRNYIVFIDKIADRAFAINNLSVKQKIDVSFEKDLEKIETQAMEKNKLNNNYYITNFQDNKWIKSWIKLIYILENIINGN